MAILRPATPGFIVTLAATVCLVLVSFSVPWFKSIFFLKATMQQDNFSGTVTFGVLGYCFETGSQVACSNATVGYEFDPQALFGIDLPLNIKVPSVVVKWITYVLILHIVGLGFAALAAFFGLLAHVRELSMTTLSSCTSGIGASIVLLAFVFDLIFFFIVKSRINAVGGSAELGIGLWLTLASWVLLFFSGCFYGFGRCCISKRPRGPRGAKDKSSNVEQGGYAAGGGNPTTSNTDAMRMEAIKAENERKRKQAEQGLPSFPTQAEAVPLRKDSSPQYYYETDSEDDQQSYRDDYRSASQGARRHGTAHRQGSSGASVTSNYAGRGRPPNNPGYIPAPPGRNPLDLYNNNNRLATNSPPTFPSSPPPQNVYPPQTHYAQPSASYSVSTSPPPMPVQQSQYLSPPGVGSGFSQQYGHVPQESSYHSAYSHQPGYTSYDPYGSTNPYSAAGVGRPPGDSLYITAQNTPAPAPPMPSVYPNAPTPPVPHPQSPPPPESYNPFAQHTQTPTQYTAPDQAHVAAPWLQTGHMQRQATMPMPTATPAQPPPQNVGVPHEAPPGYDWGAPGGYQ